MYCTVYEKHINLKALHIHTGVQLWWIRPQIRLDRGGALLGITWDHQTSYLTNYSVNNCSLTGTTKGPERWHLATVSTRPCSLEKATQSGNGCVRPPMIMLDKTLTDDILPARMFVFSLCLSEYPGFMSFCSWLCNSCWKSHHLFSFWCLQYFCQVVVPKLRRWIKAKTFLQNIIRSQWRWPYSFWTEKWLHFIQVFNRMKWRIVN